MPPVVAAAGRSRYPSGRSPASAIHSLSTSQRTSAPAIAPAAASAQARPRPSGELRVPATWPRPSPKVGPRPALDAHGRRCGRDRSSVDFTGSASSSGDEERAARDGPAGAGWQRRRHRRRDADLSGPDAPFLRRIRVCGRSIASAHLVTDAIYDEFERRGVEVLRRVATAGRRDGPGPMVDERAVARPHEWVGERLPWAHGPCRRPATPLLSSHVLVDVRSRRGSAGGGLRAVVNCPRPRLRGGCARQ